MNIRSLILLAGLFVSLPALAAPGAIWTSYTDGTVVNGNVYPSKDAVYLNGGPQGLHGKGLPNGLYYFQVTNPSGADLLSLDNIKCRAVKVVGGVIAGAADAADETANPLLVDAACSHANGNFNPGNGSTPVQLCNPSDPLCANDYADTSNSGGEYKAWLTPIGKYSGDDCNYGFCNSDTKTDNFKVRKDGIAYVIACKFNDMGGVDGNVLPDGIQQDGEPTLSGWPITATGVDPGAATVTDTFGCISFTVSNLDSNGKTVTVTEDTLGTGWYQTGLLVNDVPQQSIVKTVTRTVYPGDTLDIDFGNHNDDCSQPGSCVQDPCALAGTCDEPALEVTKTATPSYKVTWKIKKTASKSHVETNSTAPVSYTVTVEPDKVVDIKVTGTISVKNLTSADAFDVSLADSLSNCTIDAGPTNPSSFTVLAGATVPFTYTCTYDTLPTTTSQNVATASWPIVNSSLSVFNSATIDFANATVTDKTVTVSDSLYGSLGSVTYPASKTFDAYTLTLSGTPGACVNRDNTATFTTNTTGTSLGSTATVEVCVGADLTVVKTVNPTFTRKYNWTISKSADKTILDAGGTATYTVIASETGWTDSLWSANGSITVTNPNAWEDITFNLADAIGTTGCTITGGGTGLTVLRNSSTKVYYTCPTFSSGADFLNTATATWNSTTYSTPSGSGIGTKGGSFVTPTTRVNQVITVTDPMSPTTTLGMLTATDSSPLASGTYTYSKLFTPPASGCTNVKNTATATGNSQPFVPPVSASVTVANCNTGGLTIGYWQNSNGQAIITGQAKTGTCPSATFLRTFLPFQDLSATATCAQVATYATNIIKAANASGAAMNAMLKAQMLATALDVYFSDPALGGNKIGAPVGAPLGGVVIDLTKICPNVASCTSFIPTSIIFPSSVFPTAPHTVLNLLKDAAAASNSGGSVWYGQVKTTQELAKDTFDAINNQKVFSP